MELIEDALAVQEAGAFSILVEALPPEVTRIIRDTLSIPVYGIGAGVHTDGEVMICSDILGIFQAFTPKFVKKYANLGEQILNAFKAYAEEVRERKFPGPEHGYSMAEGEISRLQEALSRRK